MFGALLKTMLNSLARKSTPRSCPILAFMAILADRSRACRFSQLAKLDLELSLAGNLRPLGQLEALPSLRELDVTGRLQAGYAKPLLAPFVNLETLDLHLCCTEGNVDLKESFDCSSLR